MASFAPESYESSNTDGALLLSQLLDESHVEDYCDDERLRSVIRSLEAEIIEPTQDDASFMELEWDDNFVDIDNYTSDGLREDVINGRDCSTPSDIDDVDNYNWMDMEEGIGFGVVGDDYYEYCEYNNESYNVMEEASYGSLWQDTNVVVM